MMNFDLELILVVAAVVTGVLRYGHVLLRRSMPHASRPWFIEWSYALFPVLVLVLVLRSFVVEPFRIPSGSMIPTLLIGDLILVNKFHYGLRLPVSHNKILDGADPARGDVVVFRYPQNSEVDYIKRVVGVPGDQVRYFDKQLEVNGERYPKTQPQPYIDPLLQVPDPDLTRYTEVIEGRAHSILTDQGAPERQYEFVVPENQYLVMGDNRDRSSDSRRWGFVPEDHLVGRAFYVWMNYDFLLASLSRDEVSFMDRLGSIE